MILHPGFKLNNKYTIIERLGDPGAFGVVFRAVEELSGLEVAIKEFFIAANPEEMQVLAKLRHPNIIQYITHEAHNDTQFMVMEYASSGNLEDIIAQKGKLMENEALSILSQIAEALTYAHSQNIVHRDIKPLNIFCVGGDVYKLGDFGIARMLEKSQSRTAGRGSIYYSAPELFEGKFTRKTDVYALGVTFYEMLTGKQLYTGTEMELMRKIIDPKVRPVVPIGVSQISQTILEGCLEKELEERWDLAKLLESIGQSKVRWRSNNGGKPAFQGGSKEAAVARGQAQVTVGRVAGGLSEPLLVDPTRGQTIHPVPVPRPVAEIKPTNKALAEEEARLKAEEDMVEMVVFLGHSTMRIRDLLKLAEGDVIPLNQSVNDPLPIYVGELMKFKSIPGLNGEHLAVQLTEIVQEGGEQDG